MASGMTMRSGNPALTADTLRSIGGSRCRANDAQRNGQ